jgi:hypothetical protein
MVREQMPERASQKLQNVNHDIVMSESHCPWLTGWCDRIQLGTNQLARGQNPFSCEARHTCAEYYTHYGNLLTIYRH